MKTLTYRDCGVDYASGLDAFKIAAQKRAELTNGNAGRFSIEFLQHTRGESAALFKQPNKGLLLGGVVEEGLGTKNLVADATAIITGLSYYDRIAQDTIAMIVNDAATLGVSPITLCMHLAVESSDWFKNEQRAMDLINGWGDTCDKVGCIWTGGETPILQDIIVPGASLLSGSTYGICPHDEIRASDIRDGDVLVGLPSSGIHANGLTMARRIVATLPDGYATPLPSGISYGEALLQPTHIYNTFVEFCQSKGIKVSYCVNVTGHGFRKIMRANENFTYVVEYLPQRLEIFDFLMEHGPVTLEEMFKNMNMGVGYVLIMRQSGWEEICLAIKNGSHFLSDLPYKPFLMGYVEKSKSKKVVIEPVGLEFAGDTLEIR